MSAVVVHDMPERQRYEATRDDEFVGFVDYRRDAARGAVLLTHAETVAHLRGQGIGEQIVRGVLADLSARSERIVPVCGFVRSVVRGNPDYERMLA
jgi:predicted GNAT family acetyltransferase